MTNTKPEQGSLVLGELLIGSKKAAELVSYLGSMRCTEFRNCDESYSTVYRCNVKVDSLRSVVTDIKEQFKSR